MKWGGEGKKESRYKKEQKQEKEKRILAIIQIIKSKANLGIII